MLNPDSDYELSKQQNQKNDEQDSASSSSSSSHAQQAASSSNSLSPRHTNAALSDDGDNEVGDEISSQREYSTLPTSSSSVEWIGHCFSSFSLGRCEGH